jgi:hypothetical protein
VSAADFLSKGREGTARARAASIRLARLDPAFFCRYVLRDEKTGKPIHLAPVHKQWHALLNESRRAVIWSHVDAGKTNQITIGRVLWQLGHNPNLRIAIIQNTLQQAKQIIRALAQYIERSPELHDVFPHLKRAPELALPWNTTAITVERKTISKDPSVQALGVHGNVTGARLDGVVFDDILDMENTRTHAAMDDLWLWIQNTVLGRLTEDGWIWAVGNAWHPKDAMHRLAALPRYVGQRFPVLDERGASLWPERWSKSRIEATRDELGQAEFGRQLLCLARDDAASAFKREWIDVGIKLGKGYKLVHSVNAADLPPGFAIFTGVDLAVSKADSADYTCLFTILLHPDGARQVLGIDTGKWGGPEIIDRIRDVDERYGGLVIVENVAAQQYIVQFARKLTRAVVRGFKTGKNKADPAFGVQTIAAEMEGGRWIIPNTAGKTDPEVGHWITEMLHFDPNAHTGDRLMASWFAREGARSFETKRTARDAAPAGGSGVRVLGGGTT